jgi:NDP-sugar pyrophosphorylase family protein
MWLLDFYDGIPLATIVYGKRVCADWDMSVRTAIVLAGGAGLRLRPLTNGRPKAMIEVAGRPLLYWVLGWLRRNQVRRVVIGLAYKGERIVEYFGNGESLGLEIQYSTHTVEGGTAEGFRLAISRHVRDETFFAVNGDELTNVGLQDLAGFHNKQGGTATVAVSALRSPFGVVELRGTDIVAFREKARIDSVRVSMGVYAFQHEIIDYLPQTGEIEKTVFPRLAAEGKLKAYEHNGFWMTVNTIKDLSEVEAEFSKGEPLCRSW